MQPTPQALAAGRQCHAHSLARVRAQKGQLGHGDLAQRNTPTVVKALEGKFVVAGACGKSHTVVALQSGDSYTWGSNLVVGGLIKHRILF